MRLSKCRFSSIQRSATCSFAGSRSGFQGPTAWFSSSRTRTSPLLRNSTSRVRALIEGLSTLPIDRPLKVPHSVTVDDKGRIFVAELDGHVITEITGGTAKVVWGTGAPGGGAGQLNRPADVLAHAGYLWVADLGNHQVKQRPLP